MSRLLENLKKPELSPLSTPGYGSVPVPGREGSTWKNMLAFAGPGYLIAVGYMDPGNWATGLAGGSAFGYKLLSVILVSNCMAMLLQALAARLGIASGLNLAQACRREYPRFVNIFLWFLCEIAICACDLAEIIGTAIALQLLFGLSLIHAILLTAFDTLLILMLQNRGFRFLEAFIIALIVLIAGCFIFELVIAHPPLREIMRGFIPHREIFENPSMLYIAIGIMGATVMPHNLYLHSAIAQTRAYEGDTSSRRRAIWYATLDSTMALFLAFFINAAILVTAAAAFHSHGFFHVADIQQAYRLLSPLLGSGTASFIFALALLASGQNSAVTATMAGQIVMEGFLDIRLAPWLRRFLTRSLAIVPALVVCALYGETQTTRLLILSQVVLSMQLPFAVMPLVYFTGSEKLMGPLKIPFWILITSWLVAAFITILNVALLYFTFVQ